MSAALFVSLTHTERATFFTGKMSLSIYEARWLKLVAFDLKCAFLVCLLTCLTAPSYRFAGFAVGDAGVQMAREQAFEAA